MRRGFTIVEILVAAMLLGIMTSILTMIFSQSSVAWRVGTSVVSDLDDVRDNMAEIREEADNVFGFRNKVYRHNGLWDNTGKLLDRACNADGSRAASADNGVLSAPVLESKSQLVRQNAQLYSSANLLSVGQSGSVRSMQNYVVNVKSAGPDRTFDTWDDVWSFPDDFE